MRKRILVVVAAALVVLAVCLIYMVMQNRQLKSKARSLFAKNVELMKNTESLKSKRYMDAPTNPENDNKEENSTATDTPDNNSAAQSSGTEKDKYSGTAISDEARTRIIGRINEIMSDERAFCQEGFSLGNLSEYCGFSQKYVSQVLNETFGKSFAQLLNEKRVAVACRRFMDFEKYGHMTMEAVVRELGFKSRSTFSKTFKAQTGLTPTEFMRQSRIRPE